MAMYECTNCGEEFAVFPNVIIYINDPDPEFPYHRNKFERKFHEILASVGGYKFLEKAWNKFWEWLSNHQCRWFCSEKCAAEYLEHGCKPQWEVEK